jgi:hypothetical protein
LAFAGCDDRPPAPRGSCAAPIVDGIRETDEDAVVYIFNEWGAACTATVIAPRVVLTAKHCVLGLPARNWHVEVTSDARRTPVADYGVVETRTTPGSSIESSDIGIMILDRDFGYGFKRWEFTPWPELRAGSPVTAIGFGLTDPDDDRSSGVKYRREGHVTSLGRLEFTTNGNNACSGDSGGPIVFGDVVVGIASRVEEGCLGTGLMTRVSGFADLVREALADTGACVPSGFEVCNNVDDDCWLGVDDGLGAACGCSDGRAPATEACNRVDDDCNLAVDDLPDCACAGGGTPGVETCNGIDDDCNGAIDEVCARLGESCAGDDDCASGLCLEVGGAPACTARCTPGPGASCPEDGWCDGLACGEGLCRPGTVAGEAALGEECATAADCAGRYCAAVGESPVCARPCVPGTLSCFADEVCSGIAEGCGACADAAAAGGGRAFGEPCRTDEDCAEGFCFTDGEPAGCGADCLRRYCATECGPGGECPEGAHCRDGTCVRGPLSATGETCVADADCREGRCVDDVDVRRCLSDCAPDGSCPEGLRCWEGSCWTTAPGPGDPCEPDLAPCGAGTCVVVAGEPVCVTSCDGPGDCTSGLVCLPDETGTAGICVAPPAAASGGGGCDCGLARPSSRWAWAWAWAWAIVVASLARSMRRRGTRG